MKKYIAVSRFTNSDMFSLILFLNELFDAYAGWDIEHVIEQTNGVVVILSKEKKDDQT